MPELLLAPRHESQAGRWSRRARSRVSLYPRRVVLRCQKSSGPAALSRPRPQRECPAQGAGVWKRTQRAALLVRRELAGLPPCSRPQAHDLPNPVSELLWLPPVRAVAGFSLLRSRLGARSLFARLGRDAMLDVTV